MGNYISINLDYLFRRSKLSQDEFGEQFGLNRGSIGRYLRNINEPKIETIQKICAKFNHTIEEFINTDLEKQYTIPHGHLSSTEEEPGVYGNPPVIEKKFGNIHVEELVRYIITHEEDLLQNETFRLWLNNKIMQKTLEIYREDYRELMKKY